MFPYGHHLPYLVDLLVCDFKIIEILFFLSIPGCHLNGQHVLEGREVTLTEDPCVKCSCSGKSLTCVKKACPVLQCPLSKQIKRRGDCCPRCTEHKLELFNIPGTCTLAKGFHAHGKHFNADLCSKCTCHNGTSWCRRNTCPVLDCPEETQDRNPFDCCPRCVAQVMRSVCTYNGTTYQNNDTWRLGPCESCECRNGRPVCARAQCPKINCKVNEKLVTTPGQCCPKCVETASVCTVWGDPHFKTFDGMYYDFQGSCKYLLTSDCVNDSFSIRVTNEARRSKKISWTKTVTLKMGNIKVNLGQKSRVKVNGSRVSEFPYNDHVLSINKSKDDGIIVTTSLGIEMFWDGNSVFQVQAPTKYKNQLCGLCGNYNSVFRDDMMTREGRLVSNGTASAKDVFEFANSWRVGGTKACSRSTDDRIMPKPTRIEPGTKQRKLNICRQLTLNEELFGGCQNHLRVEPYYNACLIDMFECPNNFCYCASFTAYARECQRLEIGLPLWRIPTKCTLAEIQKRGPFAPRIPSTRHSRRKGRTQRTRDHFANISRHHTFRTRGPLHNRTPPPIH